MEKVSIIITTYCGSDNLNRAIDSVLNQTYENIEVIVVDDNDPNGTARKETEKVMKTYNSDDRVRYVKHSKNMNGSAARNTGIRASDGVYIQFLDDDDYFFPQKIELSVKALQNNPLCSMVVTGCIACGKNGIADLSGACELSSDFVVSREWLKRFNALGTGSNLFLTKKSIEAINGFDEGYLRMQDIEFIFRYCRLYKVCAIPERLIVKLVNSRPVKVNSYTKHANITNKFIDQFSEDIVELLGNEAANKWMISQYTHLFRVAVAGGIEADIENAVNQLKNYRKLTIGEKLKAKYPHIWIWLKNRKLLKAIKEKKEDRSIDLKAQLTKDEERELEKFFELYY